MGALIDKENKESSAYLKEIADSPVSVFSLLRRHQQFFELKIVNTIETEYDLSILAQNNFFEYRIPFYFSRNLILFTLLF